MDAYGVGASGLRTMEGPQTIGTGIPSTGGNDCGTKTLNNFDQNHPESNISVGGSYSDEEHSIEASETRFTSAEHRQSVSMNGNCASPSITNHDTSSVPSCPLTVNTGESNDLAGKESLINNDRRMLPETAEPEEVPCQFCADGSCCEHLESDMLDEHRSDTIHCLPECRLTPLSPVLDFTRVSYERDGDDEAPLVTVVVAPSSAALSKFWFCNISRGDKLILLCLVLIDFMSQMCMSIMAPFFPAEAESKDVSNSVSGWIFGTFALVQVVSSPIFGKLLPIMGARFLMVSGQFFSGGCIVLFGILDYIEPEQSSVFITLCFVLRVALAVGCAAASTASFAVTAVYFPDNVATVFGLLETATGLGMMLGPGLGGLLNQVGGYMLSFAVLGVMMLLTVPVMFYCLPADDFSYPRSQSISLCKILHIPAIIVVCLAVIVAALIWSILDPTLSVQLNQEFTLSSSMMGLLFLLMSCVYAMFSPIWGALADRMDDSSPMMVFGFGLSGVGLLLLGPSPLFQVEGALWLYIIALIVLGVSVGLALVPTFDKILDAIEKAGYKDDFTVYSLVAGVWGSCFAFGDFLGPVIGGWLMDLIGFPMMMTYTSLTCAVMVVVILALILYERKCQSRPPDSDLSPTSDLEANVTERTPLLSHSDTNGAGTNGRLSATNIPENLCQA